MDTIDKTLRALVRLGWRSPETRLAIMLLFAAWLGQLMETPAWEAVRASRPELTTHDLRETAGQGVTLALLGGFRSLAADFAFLKAYVAWEDRDLPTVQAMLRLTTLLDPQKPFFWKVGAEMLALDVPSWRFAAWQRRHQRPPPAPVQEAIRREQLAAAERFIKRAPAELRGSFAFQYDLVRWHFVSLRQPRETLARLEPIMGHPDATPGARRWYTELLWDSGQHDRAVAYLRAWLAESAAAGDPDPMDGYLRDLLRYFEEQR